jgi:DNA polymerase-1
MRLLLVDGHYYLYRSFFAIRGLKNSRGEPTNAIYGFIKALRKMLADVKPDRAAVIWDAGLPARRVELQPTYKQNRSEMPDDLRPQEEWLQKNISLLGTQSLELPNTEADDLIACYARAARKDGVDVVIATNDKDILQLVETNIHIYSTNKTHIADVLALTGDSSDNIPGVPGIGGKTAVQLVTAHGSVQSLLENPAIIENPRLREKIIANREIIIANREMVRLDDDLPLPVSWKSLEISPRHAELLAALRDCEFKSLVSEIEAEASKDAPPLQGELF